MEVLTCMQEAGTGFASKPQTDDAEPGDIALDSWVRYDDPEVRTFKLNAERCTMFPYHSRLRQSTLRWRFSALFSALYSAYLSNCKSMWAHTRKSVAFIASTCDVIQRKHT